MQRQRPIGSQYLLANQGFTLIELLIVTAIIGILAVIAIPGLVQAQIRSKIARVRADHRAFQTALECYYVDHQAYPSAESNGTVKWLVWMTTPIAYIDRVHREDPFTGRDADPHDLKTLVSYPYYRYYGFNERGYVNAASGTGELIVNHYADRGRKKLLFYILFSHGPDKVRSKAANGDTFMSQSVLLDPNRFSEVIYDPTNGLLSNGDIFTVGGMVCGRAEASMRSIQRAVEGKR